MFIANAAQERFKLRSEMFVPPLRDLKMLLAALSYKHLVPNGTFQQHNHQPNRLGACSTFLEKEVSHETIST